MIDQWMIFGRISEGAVSKTEARPKLRWRRRNWPDVDAMCHGSRHANR